MAHYHLIELLYGTPASTISSLPLPEPDEAGTHSHPAVWSSGRLAPYEGHYHELEAGVAESGPDRIAQIEHYREEAAFD